MKTMKRFAARICTLFVVLTVSLTALVPAAFAATKAQLPDLPSSQCVVDDANILSSSTKTAIENLNAQLTQQCEGAQIGVLTVDYTGSLSTEDYAVQAANTWGLGSSSKNNGVLILLVMQSQQYADGDYYLPPVTASAIPRWKSRPAPLPRPWRIPSRRAIMTRL